MKKLAGSAAQPGLILCPAREPAMANEAPMPPVFTATSSLRVVSAISRERFS